MIYHELNSMHYKDLGGTLHTAYELTSVWGGKYFEASPCKVYVSKR